MQDLPTINVQNNNKEQSIEDVTVQFQIIERIAFMKLAIAYNKFHYKTHACISIYPNYQTSVLPTT